MNNSAKTVDSFINALCRLEAKYGYAKLTMPFEHLVVLIEQLQLALRHPVNQYEPATTTRKLVNAWISSIEEDEPELARLLKDGSTHKTTCRFEKPTI